MDMSQRILKKLMILHLLQTRTPFRFARYVENAVSATLQFFSNSIYWIQPGLPGCFLGNRDACSVRFLGRTGRAAGFQHFKI